MLFTKHKKLILFWRNRSFSNTLIFADFCWHQQKLEVLVQQNIYQENLLDRFYQLIKFHDQIGFVAFASPRDNTGTKKPGQIGLKYDICFKLLFSLFCLPRCSFLVKCNYLTTTEMRHKPCFNG